MILELGVDLAAFLYAAVTFLSPVMLLLVPTTIALELVWIGLKFWGKHTS